MKPPASSVRARDLGLWATLGLGAICVSCAAVDGYDFDGYRLETAALPSTPMETDAGQGNIAPIVMCSPRTCPELGAECGLLDDRCGTTIDCGTCRTDKTCGIRRPNRCDKD